MEEVMAMVARLTGDGSGYQTMMKDAQVATDRMVRVVQDANNKIKEIGGAMQGFASNVMGALKVFGVDFSVGNALEQFGSLEKTMVRLRGAVELNKAPVEATVKDYQSYAQEVARVTTTSEPAVMRLLELAEGFNLTGEQAKHAVTNAIAFAAIRGTRPEDMLPPIVQMQAGNAELIRRRLQLRGVKSETDLLARIQDRAKMGWQMATEGAKGTAGAMERLKNSVGTLLIDAGGIIAKFVNPVVQGLQSLVAWFKGLSTPVQTAVLSVVMLFSAMTFGLGPITTAFHSFNRMIYGSFLLLARMPSLWSMLGGAISMVLAPLRFLLLTGLQLVNPFNILSSVMMLLRVGFMTLISPVTLLFGIFKAIMAVVGIIFSPLTIAIAAVVVGLAVFVDQMGGLAPAWDYLKEKGGEAWDYVKGKGQEFWEWAEPIRNALGDLWSATWDVIKEGAVSMWEGASEVFGMLKDRAGGVMAYISEETGITWEGVKDSITEAIWKGEFMMKNLGMTADLAWAQIRYGAVVMANELVHTFTVRLPETLAWFKRNWFEIFETSFNYVKTVLSNLAENFYKIFTNIGDLVRGKVEFSKLWTPLTEGFQNTIKEELKIPERVKTQLENELGDLMDAQQQTVDEAWQKFKAGKEVDAFIDSLFEVWDEEVERKAVAVGKDLSGALGKGVKQGKDDSILAGTADAIKQIQAQRDHMANDALSTAPFEIDKVQGRLPPAWYGRSDQAVEGTFQARQAVKGDMTGPGRDIDLMLIEERKTVAVLEQMRLLLQKMADEDPETGNLVIDALKL